MFDGLPDQFHQFIVSRTSLPLPLSFPLHASPSPNTFPAAYDPYNNPPPHHHQLPLQPNLLHPLHHQSPLHKHHEQKQQNNSVSVNLEIERDQRSISEPLDPWSNDEVLALLRIRSSVENWLPEFTWEHVSRKLAELGFKRSGEKCKEKYEEESRYFNNNINYSKNYRFLSELEELYHGDQKTEKPNDHDHHDHDHDNLGQSLEADSTVGKQFEDSHDEDVGGRASKSRKRKRKRKKKFEMLKGLCEKIVSNMMAQQEEMHNKLLEDMVKRDEEKVAKEEAWKKQEMERLNRELESMAHEQAIAGDRQTTIIELLKQFTSTHSWFEEDSAPSIIQPQNPNPASSDHHDIINTQNDTKTLARQNPSTLLPLDSQNPNSLKDDLGKRWPRDEVLALINLRCSLYSSGSAAEEEKEPTTKAPLWERISQGMSEMGYKRSAKRCKEKWENINKYFRKTKDVNKKRSVDSRTCPYFHQLTALYNQGTLVAPSEVPENRLLAASKNHSAVSDIVSGNSSTTHVAEGEKNMVQAPSFDFEF